MTSVVFMSDIVKYDILQVFVFLHAKPTRALDFFYLYHVLLTKFGRKLSIQSDQEVADI